MLIDFPVLKKDIDRFLMKVLKESVKAELGPFSDIGRTRQHEGNRGSYSTVKGKVKDKNYQPFNVEQMIKFDDVPSMTMDDVIALTRQMGKEMGEKQGKYMFKTVHETIEEAGNVVDGKGKPFSLDLMFKTLEKMEIPFDEDGNPRLPTLVINPNMTHRVRKLIAKEEVEKKYEQRHKALVERKRKEWNEKQNRRKLVD